MKRRIVLVLTAVGAVVGAYVLHVQAAGVRITSPNPGSPLQLQFTPALPGQSVVASTVPPGSPYVEHPYKILVLPPDPNVDFKIHIVPPPPGFDFKLKVIVPSRRN